MTGLFRVRGRVLQASTTLLRMTPNPDKLNRLRSQFVLATTVPGCRCRTCQARHELARRIDPRAD